MADIPAPFVGQAGTGKSFAKGFSEDINLRAQGAGYPPHAAQIVDATNEGTAFENIRFTTDDGKIMNKLIAGGATYPIPVAVASIDHANTGDNISIAAYWYRGNGIKDLTA